MEHFEPVPDPATGSTRPADVLSTGLAALDAATGGGISPGELWLVTGGPGQGRSMLLTQLAAHLAGEHQLPTYLVSSRDPASVIAARLHANRASIPLDHIFGGELTERDVGRLSRATRRLQSVPLLIAAGPYARHRTADHLHATSAERRLAAVFDDPDWESEWDLHEARRLADRGAAVVVALPNQRLLHRVAQRDDLDPAAGLADVVLEIRHDQIDYNGEVEPVTEPGRALITVLRNRRGPRYAFSVGFFAHYARFFDGD